MNYSVNGTPRKFDDIDYGTMLALIQQRAAHPGTYNGVRDAVALYRHENAYKLMIIEKA